MPAPPLLWQRYSEWVGEKAGCLSHSVLRKHS